MLSEVDAIHGGHKSMKVLGKKNEAYEVLFLFYIGAAVRRPDAEGRPEEATSPTQQKHNMDRISSYEIKRLGTDFGDSEAKLNLPTNWKLRKGGF